MSQLTNAQTTPVAPTRREVVEDDAPLSLPLEGIPELLPHGVVLRLPVRAEQVTVQKQVFVVEEAVVRTAHSRRVVRIEDDAQREDIAVDSSGNLDIVDSAEDSPRRPRLNQSDPPLL